MSALLTSNMRFDSEESQDASHSVTVIPGVRIQFVRMFLRSSRLASDMRKCHYLGQELPVIADVGRRRLQDQGYAVPAHEQRVFCAIFLRTTELGPDLSPPPKARTCVESMMAVPVSISPC